MTTSFELVTASPASVDNTCEAKMTTAKAIIFSYVVWMFTL